MSQRGGYSTRKTRQFPDWIVYSLVLIAFLWTAWNSSETDVYVPQAAELPDLGPMLPSESPRDERVLVDAGLVESGVGTAFSIDKNGLWMTARHVVDGCDEVGLNIGRTRMLRAEEVEIGDDADVAILRTDWTRRPLPADLLARRQVGEIGYFFGFPQGRAGEVVGSLIARNRMVVRGRYSNDEAILAWSELGRSRNLFGSLGGLSGAPVLDQDGEIIGVVSAESPRRGRIYSVAPRYLRALITEPGTEPEPLSVETYGLSADKLRRDRRIAQVICLVK